jgi:ABC-type polysaccharide/polyol phosphate transport system ATPase subunit
MIKVEGISKKFKLYRSPADRLREIIFRKPYHKDFIALDNISFEIGAGQTLGIIGQNGAGKSTLLKILSGIVIPDYGTIRIDGKVTGLLELGTGFNYEMTGLENVYMNGTLIAMTREEINRKRQTIIDFSELGEFINEPIKTYSSGMVMRLAFSIAIHADPTCFLIDEALSVGDAYFQQKCMRKINEFRTSGGSILFVSHDMNAVKTLCDSAILLDHGRVIESGSPKYIVDTYTNNLLIKLHQGETKLQKTVSIDEFSTKKEKISTGDLQLLSIKFLNANDKEISSIVSGELLKIVFEIASERELDDPHYGFIIRNNLGLSIYESNTLLLGVKTCTLSKDCHAKVIISWKVPLFPGDYSVSLGVANGGYNNNSFKEYLLNTYDIKIIKVLFKESHQTYSGIVDLKPDITVECVTLNSDAASAGCK